MGIFPRAQQNGRQKCRPCRKANYCQIHGHIRLVHRDTLDPCMWLNQHIQSHYRPMEMPWTLCLSSIFQWNNETLNVWSHLIGFFLLTYLQFWSIFVALPSMNAPLADYLVMCSAMFCCQVCMLLSSAYHIFGCHSPTRRKGWLRADLFGVSAGLIGLYLSGLYTSFYQFPNVQRFYGTLIGAMAISISIYVPFRRFTIKGGPEVHRIGPLQLLYVAMALVALAPTCHWIQLHGGFSNPHVQKWLPNLFSLFLLLGAAFAFYASMFPERICPGKFDLIGCSHQWWHLLILAAMAYWHWSGIQLLSHYHKNGLQIGANNENVLAEDGKGIGSNWSKTWQNN